MFRKLLNLLIRWLKGLSFRKLKPGPVRVRYLRKESDMLVYQAELPALPTGPNDADIMVQRLVSSYTGPDGADVADSQDLGKTETVAIFRCPPDLTVTLKLTYLDDAVPPNESAASTQSFQSRDNVAPDAPGAFGAITLINEEP